MLLFTLAQTHAVLGQIILQAGILCPRRFGQGQKALSLTKKTDFIFGWTFSENAHQFSVMPSLALTHLELLVLPGYFGSSVRLACSAMARQTVVEQLTLAITPMKLRVPARPSGRR